jgi:hypothetical protein
VTDRRSSLEWKVLIYDDRALSILTTLLKVSSLIEVGVTFHDSISKKRSPIPNVSAVYLVEPTEANLARIADDCGVPLYDAVYINFLSSIPSNLLEHFAAMVAARGDGSCIRQVVDQYLDFSSPDPNFFTLYSADNCLLDIYRFSQSEEQTSAALREIGESLVSVFLTAGEVPKILYKTDNEICRLVANAFVEKITPLASNLEFMGSRRGEAANVKTPLLILFDRTVDFAGPLYHPDSYQALIHDELGIVRNQCKTGGAVNDLDPDLDPFWAANRGKPFAKVAQEIKRDVDAFKQRYGQIESDLNTAIANLPELQHQQRSNEIHTHIASKLLEGATARKAAQLFKMESDCFLMKKVTPDAIRSLAQETPEAIDRLRLVTVAYLCDVIPDEQILSFSEVTGRDLTFLRDCPTTFKIRNRKEQGYISKLWGSLAGQDE